MTTYPLEPGPERMQELGQASLDWVTRFIEGLARAPSDGRSTGTPGTATPGTATPGTGTQRPDAALREALLAEPREDPSEFGELLAQFGAAAARAIETAGPAYLGYVPGGGLYVSALAEFLARSANRFTGLAATAPELAAMEHGVLRWLCRTFGLPETAGGLVTTGGSMANLSAFVAARHDRLGEDFSAGTLYLTPRTHHSAAKAARIAGLPAAAVRVVPTTADLRMDVAAAGQMIAADRQAERRPFLLVANYLQDLSADHELPDFSALGPELSRDFRGLRVWLPLRLHGVGAFRAALDEKLDLAAHAHADLARDPRLELPWPPDLSTVAFRLRRGDDDANLRFLDRINASGHVFSSSTRVGGRVLLRLCILSHRTHLVHVDRALQVIHEAAPDP